MSLALMEGPRTQAEGGDGTPPDRKKTANGLLEPEGEGSHDDLSHDPAQVGFDAKFDQIVAGDREDTNKEFAAIADASLADVAEAGKRIIENPSTPDTDFVTTPNLVGVNPADHAPENPSGDDDTTPPAAMAKAA